MKAYSNAAFHLHGHRLVVHHVIIAAEHTSAVGAGAKRSPEPLPVRSSIDCPLHPSRPVGIIARKGIRHIDFFRIIGTLILHRTALHAVIGRSLRRVLLPEKGQTAHGRYPAAPAARKPHQQIHIMAAFGQNHGTGVPAPSPIAPDKAVGLMPVAHVFGGLDGNNLSQSPLLQQALKLLIKGGIAKHMAHGDASAQLLCLVKQLSALGNVRGHRFFQQNIIFLVQGQAGMPHMIRILGADKGHVCQPGLCKHFLHRGKAFVLLQPVFLPHLLQSLRDPVCCCNQTHLLREFFRIGGIGNPSPSSGPCNYYACCLHISHTSLPAFRRRFTSYN